MSENNSDMSKKRDPFRTASGERLQALRSSQGYDQIRSFARDMGLEEDRYTAWEKGKALIPPQVVSMLKSRFGVTADWLYFGETAGLPVSLYESLRKSA